MGIDKAQIRNVNGKISDELQNIASHLGITRTALVKKHIQTVLLKYPEKFKDPITDLRSYKKCSNFQIGGLSKKTETDIENIATNIGLKKNDFIKIILFEIREMYPDHKRIPYNNEF